MSAIATRANQKREMGMLRSGASCEAVIPGDVNAAWIALRDWTGIAKWWPADAPIAILDCEPIGDPAALPFGRRIRFAQGASAEEYLVAADDSARRIYYYLENGGLPGVRNYFATTTVDTADAGSVKISFSSTFDAVDGADADALAGLFAQVYQAIARGIAGVMAKGA